MAIPSEAMPNPLHLEPDPEELSARITKALRTVVEGESMQASADFPDEVNERIPLATANAAQALAQVPAGVRLDVHRLLSVAVHAPSAAKRVTWLHRAADAVVAAYGPHAACTRGCSHCCHIPVAMSAAEARVLGKAIGRAPVPSAHHTPIRVEGYSSPCPFLHDGACSVYAHRPTVCRTHLNLDVDDLLCRLIPGQAVPVPYLDTRAFAVASLEIEPSRDAWADIRQWFPSGRGE